MNKSRIAMIRRVIAIAVMFCILMLSLSPVAFAARDTDDTGKINQDIPVDIDAQVTVNHKAKLIYTSKDTKNKVFEIKIDSSKDDSSTGFFVYGATPANQAHPLTVKDCYMLVGLFSNDWFSQPHRPRVPGSIL